MKIAIDGLNIRHGGGETVMLRVARAFARAGHEVVILSGSSDTASRAEATGADIAFLHVPQAASALGALTFRHRRWDTVCAEHGCDAAFGFNYWIPTRLPQATYHINVIPFLPFAERRRAVGPVRAAIQAPYARRALGRSTLNLFESDHIRDLATSAIGSPIRNPRTCYIGVELPDTRDLTEAGRSDQPPMLVAVTSGAAHKHNEYLFDLHRVLNEERGHRVGLKLIGVTPEVMERTEALQARKAYALAKQDIAFLGYVDRQRLFAELASSLALVSFSELESFFMVALEAMAVGCPAIVADASSIRESVGEAGLLVPPGGVEAAADHVEMLLDPATRSAWAETGRTWSAAFEAGACADAIVETCIQALAGASPTLSLERENR